MFAIVSEIGTHMTRFEAEAIEIMREVVSEAENPVMLYSVSKDSAVMLHLGKKAFYPSPPPFPLMHVDTTWKLQEMYMLRDKAAKDAGMELIVHQNPEAKEKGINPFEHGALHTDMWKTEGLKQALDKHQFDAAFVDTPMSVAEERDVKGLYAKARSGQLKNFTGIDSAYEAPEAPEIHIDTTTMSIDDAAEQIMQYINTARKKNV